MPAHAISTHKQAMQPGRCFGIQVLQLTGWTNLLYQPARIRLDICLLVITERPWNV